MTIHDELIAKTLMAKPETDEDYLNIDWDTRLITIPSTLTNIGVYNDKDTNRLYFRCPIEYGEFRIADFGLRVNYQNTGISNTKYDGDVYLVDDVESDGEYLTFSWLVGRHAYLEQGTTAFIVCCKVVDSDNNVVNELNTTIATLSVLEGLEVDVLPPEDYPDYLEEILRRCEDAEETANEALTKADSAITGRTFNCGTEASQTDKSIGQTLPQEDGAILAICFWQGNTAESTRLVGSNNTVSVIGDARCPENSVVFFLYSAGDSAFIVDAGLTRANSAITSITVNGESVPVEDNTAEITVSDSRVQSGTLERRESVTFTGTEVVIHAFCNSSATTAICADGEYKCVGDEPNWLDVMSDGTSYTMESDIGSTIYYIAIIAG